MEEGGRTKRKKMSQRKIVQDIFSIYFICVVVGKKLGKTNKETKRERTKRNLSTYKELKETTRVSKLKKGNVAA